MASVPWPHCVPPLQASAHGVASGMTASTTNARDNDDQWQGWRQGWWWTGNNNKKQRMTTNRIHMGTTTTNGGWMMNRVQQWWQSVLTPTHCYPKLWLLTLHSGIFLLQLAQSNQWWETCRQVWPSGCWKIQAPVCCQWDHLMAWCLSRGLERGVWVEVKELEAIAK